MHSIATARIRYFDIVGMKKSKIRKKIGEELERQGIAFARDQMGKIHVAPPCDVFRDIKTNDIIVKQGEL